MKLAVYKHNLEYWQDDPLWSIVQNLGYGPDWRRVHLSREYLLSELACVLIGGHRVNMNPAIAGDYARIDSVESFFEIHRVGKGAYTIEQGGRFISYLNPDEALGFACAMILEVPLPYGGLKSYEQDIADCPWNKAPRIAGLLSA